jgi:hypothetical protein
LKKFIGALFLIWFGAILVVYYVVQKPGLLYTLAGLLDTLWTLLVLAIILFNAYGLGKNVLQLRRFEYDVSNGRLLFSLGIGLGALGFLSLFFSAVHLARGNILTIFQIALASYFLLRNVQRDLHEDLVLLRSSLNMSLSQYGLFTKSALILLVIFAFLLTLAPPFEAFDALSYHLAQPLKILQDGGLRVIDIPPFWYPNITENVYLWALGMGSERAAQMIHLSWALLAIILLWDWATKTWGIEIGRKSLLLVASLASLPLLSSWAYADMALVYYSIAAILAVSMYRRQKKSHWLYLAAVMAGLSMTVKYTSFVVPLVCGIIILFDRLSWQSVKEAVRFGCIALLVALPWYIRNLIFMHNPFYPLFFNGLYWDAFRSKWYANTGTGIGWRPLEILMIPLRMTLGYHDIAPADSRIGPLFLLLLPATVWILVRDLRKKSSEVESLRTIAIFVGISFAAWAYGVINSAILWQVRFFYPALLMFAIPSALGWDSLTAFDSSRLRLSRILETIVVVVIALTVIDTGIFVLQRNPLPYAFGSQSRLQYMERVNPTYAALYQLMTRLPEDAQVFNLFEPRTYALPRTVQPDIALDNFAHDVYLYQTPNAIIQHWKADHYTHVLLNEKGLDFTITSPMSKFTPAMQNTLRETLEQLKLIARTPDKVYSIYQIP